MTLGRPVRDSLLLLALAAVPACGGGGSAPPPPFAGHFSFRAESTWTCADAVHCQDVYDFVLEAETDLTVTVTQVTGPSVLLLAVYEPGMPLGGTNLLNDTTNERRCAQANGNDRVNLVVGPAGTYRVAVGRHWGFSSGASGSYTLDVSTDRPLVPTGQTVDDQATQATDSQCP